ncbi:MAG: putative Fe-S cluster assembly protein SufT, partial [Lysobacter sp.]|nr:putative Fe-S cluster assembly protein SufT [Lysobacter sp.]
MYSRSSEPVRFERDCAAVLVPQGEEVNLPAGSVGYITQALGGSYTVFVEGNLFRIAGRDADAIGKEPPEPLELPAGADDEAVEQLVWKQLRTCFDPEIPINVVELGLVYEAV